MLFFIFNQLDTGKQFCNIGKEVCQMNDIPLLSQTVFFARSALPELIIQWCIGCASIGI